jgi:hypothetical protein
VPTPDCFQSLDLLAIRVSRLYSSGSVVYGASNAILSSAQIKLDVDFDNRKGDDLEIVNGAGKICGAYQDVDRLKHVILAMDLCQLDFGLLEMLTTSSVYYSGGNPIGLQPLNVGADPNAGVCFEAWTKAWDTSGQAVPAFTSPNNAYLHWVFPKVVWYWQKFTLQHGFLTVPVQGNAFENTAMAVHGPFNDWPAAIAASGGIKRCFGVFFDSNLPTVSCGYQNVTSVAS